MMMVFGHMNNEAVVDDEQINKNKSRWKYILQPTWDETQRAPDAWILWSGPKIE